MRNTILLTTTLLATLSAQAEITLPTFFSNGMVLQRQTEAKLWGTTTPNTQITATLGDSKSIAKSKIDGTFTITFKGLKSNTSGQSLTLSTPTEKKVIEDVLIGEVWLASGQSNMEWTMNKTDGAQEAKTANDPLLRVYVSQNIARPTPQTDFKGTWKPTAPGNTQAFTAVGYQFAKQLRSELNVPVGIIECSWGGKSVQAFSSLEALQSTPEGKPLAKQFQNQMENWQSIPDNRRPNPGNNPNTPTSLHNGMIAPLIGYGIRGTIWYQGESNANPNTAPNYAELQAAMIKDWRKRWGQEFPFYYVQLANFAKWRSPANWMIVQDEQRQMLDTVKNTGMAVTIDIGDPNNIHPTNKADVGKRLARWALKNDYGKKEIITSGPLYKSHKTVGDTITLTFNFQDGLKTKDKKAPQTFEVSGSDGKWHPATATLKDNTISLASPEVKKPTKARYAWSLNPSAANLTNSANLPASPFTSK